MAVTILKDIPFDLGVPALLKKLRIDGRPEYAERCSRLAREAALHAHPKGAYRLAYVDSKAEDAVVVNGVTLASRILRVNLGDIHRVFPFVVTCGVELEAWSQTITDMLERFWADTIMEEALRLAFETLTADMTRRYQLGKTAMMNPGSLEDWPIEQQTGLFSLLGDASAQIGVRLTESFLMVPIKSASGLRFPTETGFENCQLCPRERCPNRRAPYDASLHARRFSAAY
ncbi:MAG TPA: vitamin B12 dependent-methionine synthase activation domain-containing protein [Phycisphaerae bacterium]|nr:vitamin B12 dependent-methionine synthase activation domain-containing protein [Phycisphaerae bacterium]HRY70614.1 vitamin B12 dependent-methionine synthase activation domain-containing protein [Phycisphaerae bacterium]